MYNSDGRLQRSQKTRIRCKKKRITRLFMTRDTSNRIKKYIYKLRGIYEKYNTEKEEYFYCIPVL